MNYRSSLLTIVIVTSMYATAEFRSPSCTALHSEPVFAATPDGKLMMFGTSGEQSLQFLNPQNEAQPETPLMLEKILTKSDAHLYPPQDKKARQVENPLYNQSINQLYLFDNLGGFTVSVAVPEQDKKTMVMYQGIGKIDAKVYPSVTPHDAHGLPSGGVVGMGCNPRGALCVAVKPSDGSLFGNMHETQFGQEGSGIALVVFDNKKSEKIEISTNADGTTKEEKKEISTYVLEPTDACGTSLSLSAVKEQGFMGNVVRATPFRYASEALCIGEPCVAFGQKPAFCWDTSLNLMFVGIQAVGAPSEHAGVRALVSLPMLTNMALCQHPIAPKEVFVPGAYNEIVGACGANAQVSLHEINTMQTSTALHYLIVTGGNGAPEDTHKTVYALPLVDDPSALAGASDAAKALAEKQKKEKETAVAANKQPAAKCTKWCSHLPPKTIYCSHVTQPDPAPKKPQQVVQQKEVQPKAVYFDEVPLDMPSGRTPQDDTETVTITDRMNLFGTLAKKKSAIRDAGSGNAFKRVFTEPATMPGDVFTTDIHDETNKPAHVGGGPVPNGTIVQTIVRDDAVFVVVAADSPLVASGVFYSQPIFGDVDGRIVAWTQWQRAACTHDILYGAAIEPKRGTLTLVTKNQEHKVVARHAAWGLGHHKEGLGALVDMVNAHYTQQRGGVMSMTKISLGTPGLANRAELIIGGQGDVMIVPRSKNTGAGLVSIALEAQEPVVVTDFVTASKGVTDRVALLQMPAIAALGAISTAAVVGDGTHGYFVVGGLKGLVVFADAQGHGWQAHPQNVSSLYDCLVGMQAWEIPGYRFVKKVIADREYLYVLTDTTLDRIDVAKSDIAHGQFHGTRLATAATLLGKRGMFTSFVVSEKIVLLGTTAGLLRSGNGLDIGLTVEPQWVPVVLPTEVAAVSSLTVVSVTGREQDCGRFGGGQVLVMTSNQGNNRSRLTRLLVHDTVTKEVDDATVNTVPDFLLRRVGRAFAYFDACKQLLGTDGFMHLTAQQGATKGSAVILNGLRSGPTNVLPTLPQSSAVTGLLRDDGFGSWVISGTFGLQVQE